MDNSSTSFQASPAHSPISVSPSPASASASGAGGSPSRMAGGGSVPRRPSSAANRPASLSPQPMGGGLVGGPPAGGDPSTQPSSVSSAHIVQVVVNKDEHGYGMKVSGDNPVFVNSVKEGGPAERAGLHAGDKIIKVNGVNVMQSTHTQVVGLIKSSSQVLLTVQQRSSALRNVTSPSVHSRPVTTPTSSSRITGPQPVDNEKQYQLQLEKEQYYRLMIEKEQNYIDLLRSQIASSPDEKKCLELAKTEKNLQTLQTMLTRSQNEYPNPTHHRTKSSPETLRSAMTSAKANKRKMSESLNDLTSAQETWEATGGGVGPPPPNETPPGTPPPPYPSPTPQERRNRHLEEGFVDMPDISALRSSGSTRILANSMPIHAATPQTSQQPIMSMEDDEISDQEITQPEDHGHFKSLSKLWEHLPHLAVFTNYILSNSDPNSLLFYLITDLYKEGNAKEMRKWAFEIHSSFLVPGAPLRLSNVDENILREIDEVLTNEYDKEEILRKIFWKARLRAKEDLTRLLADFQQKRTAGLGTIFGPTDQVLAEIYNDKAKEKELYESLFLEKLVPYLEEVDKDSYDSKKYYTAAALTTVLTRIFQVHPVNHNLDKCPTFVTKEKSFRTKFIGKYLKRSSVLGHQFIAQQYYTVVYCTNCHQILYGIRPQGYQCSVCLINLHRHCVKLFEDSCPGPITKKDRGIMKLIGMRHDSNEHNKIRKSSQFLQMERERRQMEEQRDSSFDLSESGEVKGGGAGGQPVSRSGSDRRPDAVREEACSKQETASPESASSSASGDPASVAGAKDHLRGDEHGATPNSSTILPATGSNRKVNSININRSESVKEQSEKRKQQRRNHSDPSHTITSGNVDLDQHTVLSNTDSGSSSNSSISCNGRLSESPSNSVDAVGQGRRRAGPESDSDMDTEAEPWQNLVTAEELRNLSPHEKKRQDVINELFHTENSHVRNLNVLYKIFYRKILESQTLKPDELNLLFPNIKEMFDVHREINKEMWRRRKEDPIVKELGDTLLGIFNERLKKAAATFCESQQLALEFIKKRRERDSKFDAVLAECEKKRQCRRLPLQGILPTEMQRLSKYPLLLERLIHSVESNSDEVEDQARKDELAKLQLAMQKSKEILNYVNEAAKLAHNRHRLEEIQKHLDTSSFERSEQPIAQEFKTIDLTKYRLIIEGGMQLRRPNKPIVPVHILLLEEAVIILHREGDKFLLKFFQSGSSAQPNPLSPIIKMNTLLVRQNAVCKNALFLVNTSTNNSHMYDLIAEDEIKRAVWFKHFSDATKAYQRREGRLPSQSSASSKRGVEPVPADESDDSSGSSDAALDQSQPSGGAGHAQEAVTPTAVGGAEKQEEEETGKEVELRAKSPAATEGASSSVEPSPDMVAGGGAQASRVSAEDWPLIQPSQISIASPPVHTAESMLTPLEQIRRKDALVKQALEDKESLVADLLNIPREHFQHIADMAGADTSNDADPSEKLMAAIYQVDQLQKIINQSLNVDEKDVLTSKGGKHPACASQQVEDEPQTTNGTAPTVPIGPVKTIATSLSSLLTTLMSEVKQVEEERDRLRKELHRVRERLHEEHNLHSPVALDDSEILTSPASNSSYTLNDSIQVVTKSDFEEEP
ncbi:unnamed protein product [Callosobruchus maculatus]|uniref:Rho guanine nucleotide exchange factor 12 n=1 Tax=Callosobruchus maculatus TaxID=64391 RepID=A0A653CYD2_CALMS|nr:unnamed protein product [Callosobruchus maculatus]